MSMNRGGDVLAKGGVSAQFKPADVSQEEWDKLVGGAQRKLNIMSDEEREALVATQQIPKSVEVKESKLRFRAVQDRIVVRRVEAENKTDAGLFLADESKEKPSEGIVVAVGPGKYVDGDLQVPTVNVGERVVFGKFAGAELKIGLEKLLVLREEDIFIVKLDA